MDAKTRRSVLRKSITDPTTPRIKRRISFSGKHLVREFHNEEEPKTWNNSYEISDPLNVDETVSNLCASRSKPTHGALKESSDCKENVTQEVSHSSNPVINSNSILSTTKDFINLPYQNSKILHIENSIDITLYGKEIIYQNTNEKLQQTLADTTRTNIYSFSWDENEKDFMHVNKNIVDNKTTLQETTLNNMLPDYNKKEDNPRGVVYRKHMDEVEDMDFLCSDTNRPKEPVTIYMNDSMSMSYNDTKKTVSDKRKTSNTATAMELNTPTRAHHYNKENIIPTSMTNATINQIIHMDIDANFCGTSPTKVNVEKESQDFQHKLNNLSFLQESDDNMQIDITQTSATADHGAIPKVKSSRQTINFNQPIEVSPIKVNSNSNRQTVNFNEDIRPVTPNKTNPSRQTINFNDDDISQESPAAKRKPSRHTVNFNEDISVSPVKSSQDLAVSGSVRKKVVVRKICTPLVNKSENQTDLDKQRMFRLKKKLEQDLMPPSSVDSNKCLAATEISDNAAPIDEKSFNMSLSSVKNLSLSSDSFSPLIPSEFKVFNLKQLNDEIERGKIRVYSNAPKTPSTDRKKTASHFSKNVNCPELPKQRKTLVFEDADIPIAAADETLMNVQSNNYFDFNVTEQQCAFNNEKKKNAKCRYSQADDMMLDNTSFLTRAKLGDETSSRNSSKRDVTQLDNIDIIFDGILKETPSQLGNVGGNDSFVKSLKGNNKNPKLNTLKDQSVRDSILDQNLNDFNENDKKRKTMHLNDDIELCDNGFNENQMKFEMEKSNKRTTIYHDNNYMNIEGENEDIQNAQDNANSFRKSCMPKVKVVRKTLYRDIEEQEAPIFNNEKVTEKPCISNVNDKSVHQQFEEPNDKYCYNTQQQKQKHSRHTMHFDNEDIESDGNALKNDSISPKILFETSKRKTLHLNEEIEDNQGDFNSETVENKNFNNLQAIAGRQQTTLFDNDGIDIETSNITEKQPSDTLCISKDIESKELCLRNINKEKSCRTTLFLNYNGVENVNKENGDLEKQKFLGNTMHFDNEEIENEESHREEYQNIHTNHTSKEEELGKTNRQTIYLNDDIEHEHINDTILNICGDKNTDIQEILVRSTKNSQLTMLFDNNCNIDDAQTCMLDKIVGSTTYGAEKVINDYQIVKCRQTLNFNQDLDESSFEKSKYTPSETCSNKPLYVNSEVDTNIYDKMSQSRKSISTAQSMDLTLDETRNQVNNHKVSQTRKSIYTTQCMDLTLDETKNHQDKQKVSQARKSVYTPQSMDFSINAIESILNEDNQNERETVYPYSDIVKEDNNIQDGDKQVNTNSRSYSDPLSETTMKQLNEKFENNMSLVENTYNRQVMEPKVLTDKRQTLHFNNNNEIAIDQSFNATADQNYNFPESILKSLNAETNNLLSPIQNICSSKRQTIYYQQNEANIENELPMNENSTIISVKYETKLTSGKRKSLHLDANNIISINENCTPTDNCSFPELTEKPLNAAKMSLSRKTANIQSLHMTPRAVSVIPSRSFEIDPEMSEFNAHEVTSLATPVYNEISMKRLPANLTPIVSMPKKRLTLLFDNCNMEEETNGTTMKTSGNTDPMKDNNSHTKHELNDLPLDISGIVSNEYVILKTPPKQRKSRIPIPLSSEKKSSKSLTLANNAMLSSDIVGESIKYQSENFELTLKDEHLSESIEVLRRATTFTQRRDTDIVPTYNQSTELEIKQLTGAMGQPSIFEGNPITISDVSVFFTAQRNSNACNDNSSVVILPDATVPVPDIDAINMTGFNDIERNKRKSFQNRYINLTCDSPLEDIDQTRLSLVRTLSDEDDEEENQNENVNKIATEYNDACNEPPLPMWESIRPETQSVTEATAAAIATECNANVTNLKFKRRSINNLRNSSAVCRKCKRCQNTFLNETTSSTADSFALPELPPLPDLGLERLRRLRKRPSIGDVHVLWQRVSLDPINIGVDDSQIFSDTEDDKVRDETNRGMIALRNYRQKIQDFELELLASLPERRESLARRKSFVIRLEELLRNNSPNLIFDFQMQIRGIYLFTHRKMLTFSVALNFEEVDPLGIDINLKGVKIQKSHVPEKNWKPIDFVLDFQFQLNLPFDLLSLCEGISNEAAIFKMLQIIDRICVETVKMGNDLQRIVFSNHATIIRDECRTYVRKIIRKMVNKYVEKTEIKIEILNLKNLSFKDIAAPPLHHFREEVHLLPVGLKFLHEFLPNPLNYLKKSC